MTEQKNDPPKRIDEPAHAQILGAKRNARVLPQREVVLPLLFNAFV
ncbi:unnamed protein product [Larinioides sclopetarius]|uniref:Uncharacterized protein n=1 Tax=Larinioides sclopetarius TaxID=280406 RepID=A0AAV1YQW9_9ARAC